MELKNTKIVVIGGAGFTGSHLVDQLLKEPVKEIVVYDNLTRGTEDNLKNALRDKRVTLLKEDILFTDVLNTVLKGKDYVFHLAALWLKHCYDYPRAAFEVNVRGTFNVIEACLKNKIKKLIYSSSASVYGNALEIPMTEDHPFNNRTFYGATKVAGEQMCRAFNERYGLNHVGLRYMNIYGSRQDYKSVYTSVIMKVLDRLYKNKPPQIYGDGSQSYDFIHVADVARANILALKSNKTDEFYNIGAGTRTTIKELVKLILKITNSKQKIQYLPQGLTFVTHRIGSTNKAEKDLRFKTKIQLDEGIEEVIKWRDSQVSKKLLNN
ncbi:NAD-dependent epimerase/dehydratase family protein [Patescibacteria group bacterium AH-259-L05]|nr:NAD-dependent epimerase/dehydratase family protein [Patescibacteria group bacterium AH-259-L05]